MIPSLDPDAALGALNTMDWMLAIVLLMNGLVSKSNEEYGWYESMRLSLALLLGALFIYHQGERVCRKYAGTGLTENHTDVTHRQNFAW